MGGASRQSSLWSNTDVKHKSVGCAEGVGITLCVDEIAHLLILRICRQ